MAIRAASGTIVARTVEGAAFFVTLNVGHGGHHVGHVVNEAAELEREQQREDAAEHDQERPGASRSRRLAVACRHRPRTGYGAAPTVATAASRRVTMAA